MTNFEKLENMKLKDVLSFIGFDEDEEIHKIVFSNIFRLTKCSACPAQEMCIGSNVTCEKTQRIWLEQEVEE